MLPTVDEMLASANAAMRDVREIAATVYELAVNQRPMLERILANIHLASEQFKLVAIGSPRGL